MLNEEVNPQIYKPNRKSPISSNQQLFKLNYLQRIFEEQTTINRNLTHSVEKVNQSLKRTNANQESTLKQMNLKLQEQENFSNELKNYLMEQEKMKKELLERIAIFEKMNLAVMEKLQADSLLTEAILEQQSAHEDILVKMTANFEETNSVAEQLKKQEELYQDFSNKLGVHEVYHTTVMERLDQQEGLIKKLGGELDHLRAILFERTSYILEKLETHLNRITKPIQRFFINTEGKEKVDK